jgi:iron complex outermembrane receptor protein
LPRSIVAAALVAAVLVPTARAEAASPEAGATAEPQAASAGEAPSRTEVLDEIVVKSGRETRVESLEVREVRETPARDLGEALSQAGVASAVRKGGIASDVVLRGFQRDALAVTIDGARLHGACPNRMDPPSFHVDYAEVDSVEVRKGPYDVASPGGLGGTLDVRTRSPRGGASGEVNAGVGAFQAVETSFTGGYGGDRAGVLGGGAFKHGHPFESGGGLRFTEIYPSTSPNRYRASEYGAGAYEMTTFWAKGTATPAPGHRLELGYANQQADDVLYPYLRMDARYDDTNRVNASWELADAGPLERVRAQAWFNRVVHDMDDARRCSSSGDPAGGCAAPLANGRGWSMRTYAESWVAGGILEVARAGPAGGETTAGVDFYARSWDATTTRYRRPTAEYFDEASVPDVTTLDLGVRAQHVQPVGERVKLTAGVRLDLARSEPGVDRSAEYARYYADVPGDLRREDVFVSGNVQADVKVTGALSLFAGYGRGVRVPDPQERFFALSSQLMGTTLTPGTVGNPSLDPITNDQLDLGVKLAAGRLLVKAQAYHAWLSEHVVAVQVASLANPALRSKGYAGVSATSFGGEASARVALPANLYLTGSVAYVEARNETADTWLQETPPLRGAIALRYDVSRWFAEVETVMADDQTRVDAAAGETPTAGWAIANVKAGVTLRGAKLFAGVRNVFDREYYESLSYLRDPFASGVRVPEPGQVVYLNGQYSF